MKLDYTPENAKAHTDSGHHFMHSISTIVLQKIVYKAIFRELRERINCLPRGVER